MNIRILHAHAMLGVSSGWLRDRVLIAQLTAHAMGAAAYGEMKGSHTNLAEQLHLREQAAQELSSFTNGAAGADREFDRWGRVFHDGFEVLIAAADTLDLARRLRARQAFFFPEGMQVLSRSYVEEVGAIAKLRTQVTSDDIAELDAIPIGQSTMGAFYRNWVDSADELSRCISGRAILQASLQRPEDGTSLDIDVTGARMRWIRTVRALLSIAEIINLSKDAYKRLYSPLKRAIAAAERLRQSRSADDGADESDIEDSDIDDGDINDGEIDDIDIGETDDQDSDGSDIDGAETQDAESGTSGV